MKFILITFLSIFAFSCSDDVENKHGPGRISKHIESQPVNPLKPQNTQAQEHISGNGESRVSGAPSSFHISGQ